MKKQDEVRQFNQGLDDIVAAMEQTVEQEFADAGRRVGQAITEDIEAHRADVREHRWSESPITIQATMDAVTTMQEKLAAVMQTLARMAHAVEEAEHARAAGVDASADERAELVRHVQSVADDAVRTKADGEAE